MLTSFQTEFWTRYSAQLYSFLTYSLPFFLPSSGTPGQQRRGAKDDMRELQCEGANDLPRYVINCVDERMRCCSFMMMRAVHRGAQLDERKAVGVKT
jgi:hypothetical protein